MRWVAGFMGALGLGIACSACATQHSPAVYSPPDAYAASAARGQQMDDEDPNRPRTVASAQPSVYVPPPRIPPSCRVSEVDNEFVNVTCEYAGQPTSKEWEAGIRLEFSRAAAAAAVTGRDYIARLSFEVTPRLSSGRTPIQCATRINALKVLGNVLHSMGTDRTSRVDMRCSSSGSDTSCSGTVEDPEPPAPMVDPHEKTCVGGDEYAVVSSTSTKSRFRFLTGDEATAAVAKGVPNENRPVAVETLLHDESPGAAAAP
jgi:hypothetical protein